MSRAFLNVPKSLTDYERTYNNAIDLVTEAAGWANKQSTRQVAAIVLKPTKYALFVEGLKVLMQQKGMQFDPAAELTFEGYKILQGPRGQFESVLFEYVENVVRMRHKN